MEALAIEVAPFGIDTALLEPGAVSSGALDDVTTYTVPDDPYAAPLEHHGGRDQVLTPEDVAAAVADAAAVAKLPLRVPIGPAAEKILAARRAAPDDVPFAL
ncbi:MAG: hypothetical protein QOI01_6063 [Mycobacterium sp.]|nr:hypothetical protein [Mycobacterium sp.]